MLASKSESTRTLNDAGALPQLFFQQARLHGVGVVAPCSQWAAAELNQAFVGAGWLAGVPSAGSP